MRPIPLFVAMTIALAPLPALAQDAAPAVPEAATVVDPAAGEAAFRRCTACHSVGEGAANRMGPQLNGIVGQPAATREGFAYSQALTAKRDAGLIWTPQTLAEFLKDPRGFVPGTKMSFVGVKDEAVLADIIAHLATFSPDWVPPEGTAAETTSAPGN